VPLDDDLDGWILVAGSDDEAVDGFDGPFVLAERQLYRLGTPGIIALAREWDRLVFGHMARFFHRSAALVVSLERLLILLGPIEAPSAVRGHARILPESSDSQPVEESEQPRSFSRRAGEPLGRRLSRDRGPSRKLPRVPPAGSSQDPGW
jgi:hypothetical protein